MDSSPTTSFANALNLYLTKGVSIDFVLANAVVQHDTQEELPDVLYRVARNTSPYDMGNEVNTALSTPSLDAMLVTYKKIELLLLATERANALAYTAPSFQTVFSSESFQKIGDAKLCEMLTSQAISTVGRWCLREDVDNIQTATRIQKDGIQEFAIWLKNQPHDDQDSDILDVCFQRLRRTSPCIQHKSEIKLSIP